MEREDLIPRRARRNRNRRRLGLTGLAAAVAATAGGAYAPTSADGATASSLTLINLSGDYFWNYDFNSGSITASNVDWPVTLIFYGNATINRVKDNLGPWFSYQGSAKYGRLNDGAGFVTDQDSGRKTHMCPCIGDITHYRAYADADDRMYNPDWAYYVFATTHIDHNEGTFGEWFGQSEDAEEDVRDRSVQVWGASNVSNDYLNLSNYEAPHNEGSHHWNNNQYATKVGVA